MDEELSAQLERLRIAERENAELKRSIAALEQDLGIDFEVRVVEVLPLLPSLSFPFRKRACALGRPATDTSALAPLPSASHSLTFLECRRSLANSKVRDPENCPQARAPLT